MLPNRLHRIKDPRFRSKVQGRGFGFVLYEIETRTLLKRSGYPPTCGGPHLKGATAMTKASDFGVGRLLANFTN